MQSAALYAELKVVVLSLSIFTPRTTGEARLIQNSQCGNTTRMEEGEVVSGTSQRILRELYWADCAGTWSESHGGEDENLLELLGDIEPVLGLIGRLWPWKGNGMLSEAPWEQHGMFICSSWQIKVVVRSRDKYHLLLPSSSST